MEQGDREPTGKKAQAPVTERRRHKRFVDEIRVRYRDIEGIDPSRWGRTRDLSLGGLYLVTQNVTVPLESHLALEIHVENQTAPILALGRVVRESDVDADDSGAGVEFLWISEEDRSNLERLAAYLREKYGETGDLQAGD